MATPPAPPATDLASVPASLLGGILSGLQGPIEAVLRATLLRPLVLGADVTAAWAVTRDAAAAILLAALLYGILRAQLGPLVGLPGPSPWALLPRLLLGALGVATSLPLVRGLLAANNALCAGLLQGAAPGPGGLVRPLAAATLLGALPTLFTLGSEVAGVLVLIGVAALACTYIVRAAEIVLLALLLPLAAALWVVPAAEGVYRSLLGHLLVSIFVQAAQVTVLLVFATGMGVGTPGGGADWLWSIAALTLLFRCRGLLAAAVGAGARWVPDLSSLAAGLGPAVSGSIRASALLRAGVDDLRGADGF